MRNRVSVEEVRRIVQYSSLSMTEVEILQLVHYLPSGYNHNQFEKCGECRFYDYTFNQHKCKALAIARDKGTFYIPDGIGGGCDMFIKSIIPRENIQQIGGGGSGSSHSPSSKKSNSSDEVYLQVRRRVPRTHQINITTLVFKSIFNIVGCYLVLLLLFTVLGKMLTSFFQIPDLSIIIHLIDIILTIIVNIQIIYDYCKYEYEIDYI
jgi:hypothetical protein